MLERIKTEEIKEKLKQRTQEALDLGVSEVIGIALLLLKQNVNSPTE